MTAQELRPMVQTLWAMVVQLQVEVAALRDEVAVLKGLKARPKFKGANMDRLTNLRPPGTGGNRAGSAKRSKTAALDIHEDCVVQPVEPVPAGSTLVGYRDFVVQDLHIAALNTRYRRAVYRTPDGRLLVGARLPEASGSHFGPTLRAYVLYQHHHCHVTQPKLVEQLREWGVDISVGQLNALLTQGSAAFTAEKTDMLVTGLRVSPVVTVDDSGARHAGTNGYVLNVSTPHFAWFESTNSKSRTNFLELLHAGQVDYRINAPALDHMARHGLAPALVAKLRDGPRGGGPELSRLHQYMRLSGITGVDNERIVTEAALWGALAPKVHPQFAVVSDGAGQFVIAQHGLCWVHAERLVHKLVPVDDAQRTSQVRVRSDIWVLFAALKAYKLAPTAEAPALLLAHFERIFRQKTGYPALDELLARLYARKDELLLVLRRPEVPLHTNMSETDLRDRVKKRKISGGTRGALGRTCRDTFASLLKTCRKLDVSFWDYLTDRLTHAGAVPQLSELIKARSALGVPA